MTERSTAAPGRRDRNREKLYLAALELFAEQGYDATTMNDIAARAGLARRSAFNHFPAKSDITVEWTARRRAVAAPAPGDVVDGDEREGDVPARVRTWFRALAEHTEATAAESEQMVRGWLGAQGPVQHPTGTPEALTPWLEAGRRAGSIDPGVDAALAANLLFDAYLGALYRWFRTAPSPPGTLVADVDAVIDLALTGIGAAPRRPDDAV